MSLRRAGLLALPLALAACTEVTQQPLPTELVFASFASPNIPTPNDLALAGMVTRLPTVNACATPVDLCASPPNAQVALLCSFRAAGGFPSDQEVPISIPITARRWDPAAGAHGAYVAQAAPAVDLSTVDADTVSVYRLDTNPPQPFAWGTDLEAATTPGSCSGATCTPGVLTIRKKADATGSRRWPANARISFAIRGGVNGVKTVGGLPISADSAIELSIPNRDLTKRENQPLGGAIPDGSAAGSCGAGSNADEIALLENVRQVLWNPLPWCYMPPGPATGAGGWNPVSSPAAAALCQLPPAAARASAYGVITAFPANETAAAAAFSVAPSAGTVVLIDSGSGAAPLPIDLLRTGPGGTIANNPAFGAAGAGLATLDGFSTTAMLLAQTSGPIDASTVNGANVLVYKLGGAAPVLVRELKAELGAFGAGVPGANPGAAGYVAQPGSLVVAQGAACPIAGGCSTVIGLQPGVAAPTGTAFGTAYLPPLDQNALYAVIITNRVKSVTGAGLVRPSVAKILLEFTVPLAVGGKSAIPGVGDATAQALEDMRDALEPVWDALPAGTTKADVATAYTFKTQSITGTALQLAAAPYAIEAGGATPTAIFTTTAAPVAVTAPAGLPTTNVAGFYAVTFNGLDAIDKATGAFRATLASDLANPAIIPSLISPLTALVAVPDPATAPVPLCPGAPATGPFCPKLVIFGHGLNGSKETMFTNAAALASQGFVAAAIDFPLHGGRNWCAADADCVNTTTGADGTCDKAGAFANSAGQGDAVRPGVCGAGSVPKAAGSRYFVSANFFRTRDALRQNLIDTSTLALALARPPAPLAPQPAANPFASLLATAGLVVDPSAVYYEGISLGSIAGTSVVAVNPRVTRASLSVGGGTLTDVFTTAPAFQANVDALFAALIPGYSRDKITAGSATFDAAIAAAYLRTLNVAKWILDPGDPINYAGYPRRSPLPNLLANPNGSVPQGAKAVYGQIAKLDAVVPNANNELLYALMGADLTRYDSDLPDGSVPHGMLGSPALPFVQGDAAGYLADPVGNLPPTARTLPLAPAP